MSPLGTSFSNVHFCFFHFPSTLTKRTQTYPTRFDVLKHLKGVYIAPSCVLSWGRPLRDGRKGMSRFVSNPCARFVLQLTRVKNDSEKRQVAVRKSRKLPRRLQVEVVEELLHMGESHLAGEVYFSLRKIWSVSPPFRVLARLVSILQETGGDCELSNLIISQLATQDKTKQGQDNICFELEANEALIGAYSGMGQWEKAEKLFFELKKEVLERREMREMRERRERRGRDNDSVNEGKNTEVNPKGEKLSNVEQLEKDPCLQRVFKGVEEKREEEEEMELLERSCSRLGMAYKKANRPEKIVDLIAEVSSQNLSSIDILYCNLLRIYANSGQLKRFEQVLKEIDGNNVGINCESQLQNEIFRGYLSLKEYDKCIKIFTRILSLETELSLDTVNAIVNSLGDVFFFEDGTKGVISNNNVVFENLQPASPHWAKCFHRVKTKTRERCDGKGEILLSMVQQSMSCRATWQSSNWSIDLHGLHPISAHLFVLMWLFEIWIRLSDDCHVANSVTIVTGWGRHSTKPGESSIHRMVKETLENFESPFKVGKVNKGVLESKGENVRVWILESATRVDRNMLQELV